MGNGSHALLSASSSHRWLECTPSAFIEREFEDSSSSAAQEGTVAHELCEHKLRLSLNEESQLEYSELVVNEMEICTDEYVAYVMEQIETLRQSNEEPVVLIEQRLNFSKYVPEGFGTGDCVLIANNRLHIVDFKYGKGILVNAEDNSQMKLYALGALEMFGVLYDIEEISMTIFQPRRDNVSTWTIPISELLEWAETELKEKADLASKGEGNFVCGDHCTFCRANVRCRARAEEKLKLAELEFKNPTLLEDFEIEEILKVLPDLTKWASSIESYALTSAISNGKVWNGFKLVEGRSNRKIADEEKATTLLQDNGYKDIFRTSLLTLTDLEKLVGKKKFNEILGDLIIKPKGKLTLVQNSDKRKAVDIETVNDEFKPMEDENYEEKQ